MIKNNLFVLGMKRSGHHAVINWMCEQGKPSFHVNNIAFDFEHLPGSAITKHPNMVLRKAREYMADGNPKVIWYSAALKNDYNLAIYSAEDKEFSLCRMARHDEIDCANLTYVVVVRDPYNFVASRLGYGSRERKGRKGKKAMSRGWPAQIDVWKEHVRACLDKKGKSFVDINFNKWFVDKKYRMHITGTLNIPFTDEGLNDVRMGESSFDRRRFESKAQRMKVLERWKHYKNEKSYWNLIDDEMVELSKQYFGLKVKR